MDRAKIAEIRLPGARLIVLGLLAATVAWTVFSLAGSRTIESTSDDGMESSPRINSRIPLAPAPDGMAWVPGGVFWMGSTNPSMGDALLLHLVAVDGFWMDRTTVTNAQFAAFASASRYLTVAERKPDAGKFPEIPLEKLVAGALVFTPPNGPVPLSDYRGWWNYVEGANWRHPDGPASNLQGRENHPVVHIAWQDACAYAAWASKRLPTEAEFEFAARGGRDRQRYAWGEELTPGGKWMANIWQGRFPYENTMDDGFRGLAPVGSFPANGYGLHDMAGNVWQWCSDWYRFDYYQGSRARKLPQRNPRGPDDSYDPHEPDKAKRVMRGGSYLCTDQYCTAYEAGARGKGDPDTGTNHLSFRCVLDDAELEKARQWSE